MFEKYPSLENHYREKFINAIKMSEQYSPTATWVVREKIHGANFQFWTDGTEVKVGSRSQFVDGQFYNCQSIIDKYSNNVIEVFNTLKEHYDILSISVFGELFGGNFFGQKENNVSTIQRGVSYMPGIDFAMFDVRIDKEYESIFLSYSQVEELVLPVAEFKHAPFLFEGTLNDCLKYPNDKNSVVPEMYGIEYPKDAQENIMEGVVIKPKYSNFFLYNGSRAIIKSKNDKWSEKQKVKTSNQPRNFEHPLQSSIAEYINENRLNAVVSKLGGFESLTNKDFGKLLGLYTADVVEDVVKDEVLPQDWKKQDEFKPFGKWINKEVRDFLIENVMSKL